MKVITQEELNKLHLKDRKGRAKLFIDELLKLKPGQILFISLEDWKKVNLKSSPMQVAISAIRHPRGRLKDIKMSMQSAEEGWVFIKNE